MSVDDDHSFSNISKATPDQLRNLLGFGQVKVKNIKNAFEKFVRNKATRTLPIPLSHGHDASDTPIGHGTVAEPASHVQKRKDPSIGVCQPPREPSPLWNIELDLDGDPQLRSTLSLSTSTSTSTNYNLRGTFKNEYYITGNYAI